MHLSTKISVSSCGVVHDLQSVNERRLTLTPSLAPVARGKNSFGVCSKYIDIVYYINPTMWQKISYSSLESIGSNFGIQSVSSRLTQNFARCKQLQENFPTLLFSNPRMRCWVRSMLTWKKYITNSMLRRNLSRISPVLTIPSVSTTISAFIKRKQKRARVHLGLHRRSRCFGNSEGWDNVYAVRSSNQHLITKCHALMSERVIRVRRF